jgi:hypothetical protein
MHSEIELEFRVGFCGGKKTGEPGEKSLKHRREPTTNSTHIIMTPSPRIENKIKRNEM